MQAPTLTSAHTSSQQPAPAPTGASKQPANGATPASAPPGAPPAVAPRGLAGKIVGWIIFIGVVVAGYYIYRWMNTSATPAAPAGGAGRGAPLVVAARVRVGDMPVFISAIGTVQPLYNVTIHTRVNGPIVKVYFDEGQLVKMGDPLVDIDPRPFQVMVDQMTGQVDRDTAILAGARNDLLRYQSATLGSVAPQQIADQQALVDQDGGTVKLDQAALNNAKLQLSFCHITAPATGVIGLRLIDVGNIVQTTDQTGLAVIATVQPITVVFPINEDDIATVVTQFKQHPPLQVLAFDRNKDNSQPLASGKLLAIDNQVNAGSASVEAKAIFDNTDDALYPGMFVQARLLVNTLHDKKIIPTAAAQPGPNNTQYVFVIEPKPSKPGAQSLAGIAHFTPITTGVALADQIVAGKDQNGNELKGDELVVTDGVDKLQDGMAVQYTLNDTSPTTAPAGRGSRGTRGGGSNSSSPTTRSAATAKP